MTVCPQCDGNTNHARLAATVPDFQLRHRIAQLEAENAKLRAACMKANAEAKDARQGPHWRHTDALRSHLEGVLRWAGTVAGGSSDAHISYSAAAAYLKATDAAEGRR
jgi:hypothetical protein